MKRKATALLTREGGYEPRAQIARLPECSQADIQQRKIYKARRPLRQPLFADDKAGFALKDNLLSTEEEQRLLTPQSTAIDFLSVPAPPSRPKTPSEVDKSASALPVTAPAKDSIRLFGTPLTSPAFKSAGFKSLIADLSHKQTDEVAAAFLQTKAEEMVSPRLVLPSAVPTKALYKSILTVNYSQQECSFATEDCDKGPGKLEILQYADATEHPYTLIFRNDIGSIIHRGLLLPQSLLVPAKNAIIEAAEHENWAELELQCARTGPKIALEKCHIAVPVTAREDFISRFQRAVNSPK